MEEVARIACEQLPDWTGADVKNSADAPLRSTFKGKLLVLKKLGHDSCNLLAYVRVLSFHFDKYGEADGLHNRGSSTRRKEQMHSFLPTPHLGANII